MEMDIYNKKKVLYTDQQSKVYSTVWGHCSMTVKNQLKNDQDFKSLEEKDDVVGLLEKLRALAYETDGIRYKPLMLQEAAHHYMAINQGPNKEGLNNYYNRFVQLTEAVKNQWGNFYPGKLVEGDKMTAVESIKEAQEKFQAMVFLAGANNVGFGPICRDLQNTYIAGMDKYPKTVGGMLNYLSKYDVQVSEDQQVPNKTTGGGIETSFGQVQRKKNWNQNGRVICFNCQQPGYVAADCPLPKTKSLQQMAQEALCADKEKEEEEERSTSSNHSAGRQRVGILAWWTWIDNTVSGDPQCE